jgi:hypothetical protein
VQWLNKNAQSQSTLYLRVPSLGLILILRQLTVLLDFDLMIVIFLPVIVFTNTIIIPQRVVVVMKRRCSDVTVMGDLVCDRSR